MGLRYVYIIIELSRFLLSWQVRFHISLSPISKTPTSALHAAYVEEIDVAVIIILRWLP